MNKEIGTPVAYAIGGMVVGGVGTYFVIKSRLKTKYETMADEEIASIKAHYRGVADEEIEKAKETYAFVTTDDPKEATRIYLKRLDEVQALANYGDQVEELGYGDSPLEDRVVIDNSGTNNIVNKHDEELAELRRKLTEPSDISESDDEEAIVEMHENLKDEAEKPMTPYVIPVDEFFQDEQDHEKLTITYYEKDDTLVDERNQPIPDVEGTIGGQSLERFGDMSKDANIVYVRNYRLECDFEVVLDKASYTETILGIKDDEHTKTKIKRMREDG